MIDYAKIERTAYWMARKLPPSIDARDLAQEAALAALRGRKSVDGPMIDWLRRQGIAGGTRHAYRPVEFTERTITVPSFENEVCARIDVERLLAKLTPKQRRSIELQKIEGLTEIEGSQSEHTNIWAFRNRQHRGMVSLARMAK